MSSPYHGKDISEWQSVTDSLIANHPLSEVEIVEVVLKSWDDIFNSRIGSFNIGKEIFQHPK
jgi:ScaI restriction endonuclease